MVPFCSGTVVMTVGLREVIATAKHCLAGGPARARFFDGDIGITYGGVRAHESDVMLLFVKSKHRHIAAKLAEHVVFRNEDLIAFGMPGGDEWSVERAYSMQGNIPNTVSAIQGTYKDMVLIECTACAAGSSGGGVFDQEGRLVGVVSAFSKAMPTHFYFEPIIDFVRLSVVAEKLGVHP